MNKFTLQLSLITLLIITSINSSFCQESNSDINKFRYTVLDSDSKEFNSFFSLKSSEIKFKLIELKNLISNSTLYGVEVNLNTSEVKHAGSSIAFANVGRLWGVSSSAIYNNIQKDGYIFLNKNDMSSILDFLNEIIRFSNQAQDKFTLYKISVREKFQIGMLFDPKTNSGNKWEFVFEIDDAVYRMNYDKGFSLLVSLSKFNKFIIENQKF